MIAERIALEEAALLPDELRAEFDAMVAKGNTPQFAMMCLARRGPIQNNSDRAFNQSYRRQMNGMHPKQRDQIIEIAQKAGVNTNGKYYVGGLGKYGDKDAWVSTNEDVRTVCDRKDLGANGPGIKRKASEPIPPKQIRLAPDIVNHQVSKRLAADPALQEKVRKGKVKMAHLKEEAIEKHGAKKKD